MTTPNTSPTVCDIFTLKMSNLFIQFGLSILFVISQNSTVSPILRLNTLSDVTPVWYWGAVFWWKNHLEMIAKQNWRVIHLPKRWTLYPVRHQTSISTNLWGKFRFSGDLHMHCHSINQLLSDYNYLVHILREIIHYSFQI